MPKQKVHLVLGSGGARGITHIGVIDVLEENGYEIVSTAGCSMGAVVGGMHAAGFHQEYKDWMLGMTKSRIYGLFDLTLDRQGFVKGDRIFQILQKFIKVPHIEEFRIPFTAVASDIEHRREKWFTSGDLYRALRASIAIPGVFTPVKEGDHVLVDGGVLNPLPLNAVNKQEDAITVAVNLNAKPRNKKNDKDKEVEEARIIRDVSHWLKINMKFELSKRKTLGNPKPMTDILLYSYHMTQDRLIELMIEKHQPEILIDIPRDTCTTFEFHRAPELIETGRQACLKALHAFEKK